MSDNEEHNDLELFDAFIIGDTSFPNHLKEDLYINQSALSDTFAEHSERFAWYSTAYELALDHEARIKEEFSRLYARLDHATRMEGKNTNTKLTEKMVENTVITHPKYVELQEKYLNAKRNTGLLKSAKDAMIHRKDMLIQMGANYRAEGVSDLSLKEQQYKTNHR